MSQSGSDQRMADGKSNGKVSNFELSVKKYIFIELYFCYFLFSKVSEEIVPSMENLSQSGSGQRTEDEKSNGKVSNSKLLGKNCILIKL